MGLLRAQLRGVAVEIDLAPRVALDPASQRWVTHAVEDRGIDVTFVERFTERIEFGRRQPNSREALTVQIEPQRLSIEEAFPRITLPPIVQELDEIVRAVTETLNPTILPAVRVVVRKQVAAPGGDARVFLGEKILGLPGDRRAALGRPIHTVGLKLFMPPYELRDPEGTPHTREEDSIEVRVESLMENTSDLFLECVRGFLRPVQPSDLGSLGPLIHKTDDFVNQQIGAFLEIPGSEEGANGA